MMLLPYIVALPLLLVPVRQSATLTWYGEHFLGRRHAASWHQQTPPGAPEVVDTTFRGIAAPLSIPFGTVLIIERVGACHDTPSEYDGRRAIAIVVDRMRDFHNTGTYDAWPQVAADLGFGPEFPADDGCVRVNVWQLTSPEQEEHGVYDYAR